MTCTSHSISTVRAGSLDLAHRFVRSLRDHGLDNKVASIVEASAELVWPRVAPQVSDEQKGNSRG